jgi:N-acetylneuraminic acid mutarotase
MAMDPESNVVVLFGGYGNGSHLDDTWAFDPQTTHWKEISSGTSPSPRAATTLVYEPESKKLILFGGFAVGHSVVYNDTWSYDASANTWRDLEATNPPSARASYGMAYDSERKLIVLFGGFTERGYYNDVWVYDPRLNSWEERLIHGDRPSPRGAMGFAYDESNDVFIMFGGFSELGYFSDTWALDLDSNAWIEREPSNHPPPARTRMIYIPTLGESMFFGGDVLREDQEDLVVEAYDKVWSYDYQSDSWHEHATANSPSKRSLNGLAFDPESESILVFGGTDSLIDSENFVGREFQDTWSLSLRQDAIDGMQNGANPRPTAEFLLPFLLGIAAAGIAVAVLLRKKGSLRAKA